MKTMNRCSAFCAALIVLLAIPAFAAGNSYVSSKPKWNGVVKIVDATTGAAIEGAYVVGRNIPAGSTAFGVQIVNRDDGRSYDKTDGMGRARTMVGPLGTLVVWIPGYMPIHYRANLQSDSASSTPMPRPDAEGIVTIKLTPAVSSDERKMAAMEAAAWLEPAKRAPFINLGRRANRSVELRSEVRESITKEGGITE